MKDPHAECPISKVVQLLSDAWTMLIMHFLLEGPKRFCELERSLAGISTRTLALKLKKLAAEGMVKKADEGSYAITEKGKGLRLIENAMKRYQEEYL